MTQVDKRIRGKLVTQREFVALVAEGLRKGDRTAKDIARRWGDDAWLLRDQQLLILKTLGNLEARGLAIRASRGVYDLNVEKYDTFGPYKFDQTENAIVEAIRERGGYATMKELAEHFDCHPGDNVYIRINQIIRVSKRIRKDFGDYGQYNLTPEVLAALPLKGRDAHRAIRHAYGAMVGGDADLSGADGMISEHFTKVGAAFAAAMALTGGTIFDAAEESPEVRAAMETFAAVHREVGMRRTRALSRYDLYGEPDDLDPERGETARLLRAKGASDATILAERDDAEEEFDRSLPGVLWDLFVAGHWESHLDAPTAFYFAAARYLKCDPAALSRGVIFPLFECVDC
jgi:hypothetical protein